MSEKQKKGLQVEPEDPKTGYRFAVRLSVLERIKNASHELTYKHGREFAISRILERAAEQTVIDLEKEYNSGEPFPPRPERDLKVGRPPRK